MTYFDEPKGKLWRLSFDDEKRRFVWCCLRPAKDNEAGERRRADNDNAKQPARTGHRAESVRTLNYAHERAE